MNPELQKTDASVTIHGRKSSPMDLFEGNTNDPEMLRILFQLTFYQQRETKSKLKVFTKFSTANCRVHDISLAFWTRRTD